ncbi:MAG: DUF4162 domain-containing protein [Chloroflexota bacterium]
MLVAGEGAFAGLPGVAATDRVNGLYRLALNDGVTARDLFRTLAARSDLTIEHFEVALPSLEEVFLRAVGDTRNA